MGSMIMAKVKTEYECSLELADNLIGGKWKLRILWHLIGDKKRFSDLRRDFPDITQKILTQQLRELEDNDLIHREVYPVFPPRVEYSLTEEGQRLIPVLKQLCDWSSNYADNHDIKIK